MDTCFQRWLVRRQEGICLNVGTHKRQAYIHWSPELPAVPCGAYATNRRQEVRIAQRGPQPTKVISSRQPRETLALSTRFSSFVENPTSFCCCLFAFVLFFG